MGGPHVEKTKRKDLIYPEESYQIIGVLFEVYNEIGYGYQEKHYQRAVACRFRSMRLPFTEQVRVRIKFDKERIGHYFLDFLVDQKIILELKRGNYFSTKDIEQVYAYLRATKLQLGIIANITSSGIIYKRILNLY
ncbi:MAG: GxxExxY protein [Parcubacteria group bacterium]